LKMSSRELTERQRQVLEFIAAHLHEVGYPPTIREIASHFNMSSAFGVQRHLTELQKKGYLRRETGARRALTLAPEVLEALEASDQHTPVQPRAPLQARLAPVLGKVAAGIPISAQQHIEDQLPLPEAWFQGHDLFLLRVQGDSMAPGIESGDLVIVRPQATAENGTVVVALLEHEATVKRFFREPRCIILRSDNPSYADIRVPQNCQIQGRVTGLIRRY
jgi:repressor LexA